MSVEIVKAGKWQLPINRNCRLGFHTHDFYQLIFTQNSIGTFALEDAEYPYKPEHLYITAPGVPHECRNKNTTQYIIIYFNVLSATLTEQLRALPTEIAPHDVLSCKQLLSHVSYEYASGTEFGMLRANAYLSLFLSACLDSAPKLFTTTDVFFGDDGSSTSGVDLAANYIYNNFSSDILIDDLVEISHFQRRHFFRIFKEKFGTTPNKYINELRMNKAKALLSGTNMSIAEVSESCGFKTEHYFSRAFKEREGISPHEFRMNAARANKEIIF